MKLRMLAKLGLAALLVAATALPARAADITVTKLDGVSFQYQATVTNGVLSVNFANPFNFVTQVNNTLISPITAEFAPLTLSPTALTDDIPGLSGHFTPDLNSTKIGLTSLTPAGAPNVVFDYSLTFGQVAANGLTLSGAIALDPASAQTLTIGADTYHFSQFNGFAPFTLSLGTQDPNNPNLLYDVLKSGNGSFTGTAQFDAAVSIIPEPTSVVLVGVAGLVGVWSRRRKA